MENEIELNGITYVKKEQLDNSKYCIIRAESAGVFAGYLESVTDTLCGRVVILKNFRRLWYWSGAASLSQLAVDGTAKPSDCKFPCVVEKAEISKVIEIIYCTDKARKSIEGVNVWEQK